MELGENFKDSTTLVHNAAMESGRQEQQPPQYYYNQGQQQATNATSFQQPPVQYSGQHTAVQMTNVVQNGGAQMAQPMVIEIEPQTKPTLIISVLATIFCFVGCAPLSILIAWQARLQALDKKYAHSRHTLVITWIFLGFTIAGGIGIWGMMIWLFTLINRDTYYYNNNGYNG